MILVKSDLSALEKYLLTNRKLYPTEWKRVALPLQCQRVPDKWETPWCRPSIHTLKSWLKKQNDRYIELSRLLDKLPQAGNLRELRAIALNQPNKLFESILIEYASKCNLDVNDV
jgi:hypothetical protein